MINCFDDCLMIIYGLRVPRSLMALHQVLYLSRPDFLSQYGSIESRLKTGRFGHFVVSVDFDTFLIWPKKIPW